MTEEGASLVIKSFKDLRRETRLKSHEKEFRTAFRKCRHGHGIVH